MKIYKMFGILAITAVVQICSAESTETINNVVYTYEVADQKATITAISKDVSGVLELPDTLGGFPVVAIGDWAFSSCSSLAAINVSEENLFFTSIDGVLFNKDGTELIQCPGGKSGVCRIPVSVTSIRDNAFEYYENPNLLQIEVPVNATYDVSRFSFLYPVVRYDPETGEFVREWMYELDEGGGIVITGYTYPVGEIVIPSEINGYPVVSIGDYAFSDSLGITSVIIEPGVKTIGMYAFAYCYKLSSVTLPNTVLTIGESAFDDDDNLIFCNIPESVTTIEGWAFYGCNKLSSISIPQNVSFIGDIAFGYCHEITSFEINENNPYFTVTDGVLFSKDGTELIQCVLWDTVEYRIPAAVTSLRFGAFYGCENVSVVAVPETATYDISDLEEDYYLTVVRYNPETGEVFPEWEYEVNEETQEITITGYTYPVGEIVIPTEINGYSVVVIGSFAFEYRKGLTSVSIPDTVSEIEECAFRETALTSITIPESVTKLGDFIFDECAALKKILLPKGHPHDEASLLYGTSAEIEYYEPSGSTATESGVPHSWIDDNPELKALLDENGGDYEAVAAAPAANGVNTIGECYIAGLNPTEKKTFNVEITFVDGKPVITYDPDRGSERVYVTEGGPTPNGPWSEVKTDADKEGKRFFRVKVFLP